MLILLIFGLAVVRSTSTLLSCHCCLFKFFQEFRLEDSVDSQILNIDLDSVSSIKSFLDELRILDLILEEASEILIFMSSQIWDA